MVLVILPLLFPLPQSILNKPIGVQVAHWAKMTKNTEAQQALEGTAKTMGPSYHQASYGSTPTRIANFTIPSVDDKNHSIPVMCACPHDATLHSKLPLVLYFYGGGFILGSIGSEILTERWLAQESNSIVCAVGYRLAPEFPYPSGVNDAIDAAVAILEGKVDIAKELESGLDLDSIGTWGVSAGGYMAAQASRRLTERGYNLKCQVSLIPMAKPYGGTQSILENWNDVWSGLHNTYAWTVYLRGDDGTLAADWKVNLLIDPPLDVVKRLPPTYVEIHSRDVLHDEGELYAKRLEAQGKLIELKEYDVSHVGSLPAIAKGGSAEGADVKAASILKEYLYK